jgi:cytochrome c biogenesis protein CcmG/thiol:disulfide interchange protein DsbE
MRVRLRTAAFGVASLAIIALMALMAWALSTNSPVTGLSGITRVQQPVPELTLSLLDGGELVLSEWAGYPIVINFWASWCTPCRDEAGGLERTWRLYKDRGVLFVGVNVQDPVKDAVDYMNEFGISYPNGRDVDGKITVDYGVIGLPVTFFVSKDGIVARRWVGAIPEAQLVDWVDGLESGAGPTGVIEGSNPERFLKLEDQP